MFTTIDRFFGQSRWHRDGQQVLRFHIKSPRSPCQLDVKQSGLSEGLGNVDDGGMARFDEYKVVVGSTIWLGQLGEHLIHKAVEEEFLRLSQGHAKGYCVTGVQLGEASYTMWVIGCFNKFTEFDVIFVELGNRESLRCVRVFTFTIRDTK